MSQGRQPASAGGAPGTDAANEAEPQRGDTRSFAESRAEARATEEEDHGLKPVPREQGLA